MNSPKNVVEMKDVRFSFGNKVILDGVDMSLASQDVLVVMGTSGGGKSTFLSLILGLIKPISGAVLFKGEDIGKMSRSKLNDARTHIGMVYQNAALISSKTVRENVGFPLEELTDKSDEEIAIIVAGNLELVGLKDAGPKLPAELSGGMQRRVGLARALALDPELILFDEPTAGLDPLNSKSINELIMRLRDEKKVTSIVVTHDMESAFSIATRMAFLAEGKIVVEASPQEFEKCKIPFVEKFLEPYLSQKKPE